MAKSGTTSRVTSRGTERSAETREQLVLAAIEVLMARGFAGASARAIAEEASTNQGLIFYHFGSVSNLLLAALDHVSESRMIAYQAAVDRSHNPSEMVQVAGEIFRHDLESGYVTVLVEMIAGSSSVPGLGDEVANRIDPWFTFARNAVESSMGSLGAIVESDDAAYGVVALYLGLEMLSHLTGDQQPALKIFKLAEQVMTILGNVNPLPATTAQK